MKFPSSLFGCPLQPASPATTSARCKPGSNSDAPRCNTFTPKPNSHNISTLNPSLTSKTQIQHLEILITRHDLLPLNSSSPSILDSRRLFATVLPFPSLQTVTLLMGMRRQTDMEELCLSQELGELQSALDEFLVVMRGGENCCLPRLRAKWLFDVEKDSDSLWLDLLGWYGIEV